MKYTAAMIVLLAAPLVSAPAPKVIREIDLNQVIPARPDFAPFAIVAFSPDENWVALAVGAHQIEHYKPGGNIDPGHSTLLLVPLNGTADKPVQIDPGLQPTANLAWSPDSATVLVEGFARNPGNPPSLLPDGIAELWNLRGEEVLRLLRTPAPLVDGPPGGIFGFVDSKHLLARRIPVKGMPSAFETTDLQGQVVDTWTVPKHWTVADISPERGLLAILTDQASKTLVVDSASKKVILSKANPSGNLGYGFPLQASGGSWQYFTERGKTLCSVGSVGKGNPQFDTTTECWAVDSGSKIARFDGFPGGAPAAASSDGSRLVLTHELAFPIKGDEALVFSRGKRVVWDFRSGAEIAAWEVPQTADPSHIADRVAISASGRYVAETRGALLRIYELP